IRNDQDYRPRDLECERFAVIRLCDFERIARGDRANGLRDLGRNAVYLVENKYPVLKGELQQFLIALGKTADRRGGWIDESAKSAGEDRLSTGHAAAYDPHRIGTDGPEGGREPEEGSRAVGGRE